MYIEPRTNIRILKDVPLDTTYEHTIYFDSANSQYEYFISLQKYNLTNYSYQRVKRGTARVGIKADNLYDCNYMMFQNSAYGNKWFYAYITSVEFLNNETSEITFEIDVMQTWFFDCAPDYCFVEREHSVTDNIGDNILPESVDCGEYVFNGYGKIAQELDPLAVVIMISDEDVDPDGTLYDGVYGGTTLFAYVRTDIDGIKAKLKEYAQKPDAVVGMYMCPIIAFGGITIPENTGIKVHYRIESTVLRHSATISTNDTLDGYRPKNRKMYTYPYNFLQVNTSKNSASFRYEFFNNLEATLRIDVPITMPLQIVLRPENYKGSNGLLVGDGVTLDEYPMCSWNTDAYQAWLAQNSIPNLSTIGKGMLDSGGLAPLIAPAIGVANIASGGVSSVLSALASGYRASVGADITKGNINSGSVDVASKTKNFFGGRCSVSRQYARIIDDYFTMFGYATKQVKIPNRNSRPHWNYVKTIGCTITGSVPADDMKKICSIYDKGVTFWKHGNEVGNYTLDNSPV